MTIALARHLIGILCVIYALSAGLAAYKAGETVTADWLLTVVGLGVTGLGMFLPDLFKFLVSHAISKTLSAPSLKDMQAVMDATKKKSVDIGRDTGTSVGVDSTPSYQPSVFSPPVPTSPVEVTAVVDADPPAKDADITVPQPVETIGRSRKQAILRQTDLLVELLEDANGDPGLTEQIKALNNALFRKNFESGDAVQ